MDMEYNNCFWKEREKGGIMESNEIKKNKIIKNALLYLGFPYSNADSKEAAETKAASSLFDIALNSLLKDNDFTFNVKRIVPVLTDRRKYLGKYEFIKPEGYICSMTPGIEDIGDKLQSVKNNFVLEYKRRMDIKDIPEEYEEYLSLLLAEKIAPVVGKAKALERIMLMKQQAKMELIPLDSYVVDMEDLV